MQHRIDPKVDCVFKALLGSEENRNLLIHFLNATLVGELKTPITTVDILNPYNDREFIDDKLSVVDVKAKDDHDQIYQVEIQLHAYENLPARIIYNWSDIHSQQLQTGKSPFFAIPDWDIPVAVGSEKLATCRAFGARAALRPPRLATSLARHGSHKWLYAVLGCLTFCLSPRYGCGHRQNVRPSRLRGARRTTLRSMCSSVDTTIAC